jgi:MFS family permease
MLPNNDSSLTLRTITTESTILTSINEPAVTSTQTPMLQSTNNQPSVADPQNAQQKPSPISTATESQPSSNPEAVKLLENVTPGKDHNDGKNPSEVKACTKCKSDFFSTINSFTFFMCLIVMLTNALTVGYRNSVITTIEKCYEFSSIISGILSGALEVGSLIATLIVSYFCAKSHIPRCIALSSLMCSLGSLMYALPHFLSKSYTLNNKVLDKTTSDIMCKLVNNATVVRTSDDAVATASVIRHSPMFDQALKPFGLDPECLIKPSHYAHFVTLIIANVLIGTSSAPLYTLGTAYIDNHVSQENASIYLAFIYSMLAFGPLVGYLAGAALLQLYVDTFSISNMNDLKISPSDSNWVGGMMVEIF